MVVGRAGVEPATQGLLFACWASSARRETKTEELAKLRIGVVRVNENFSRHEFLRAWITS